MNRGILLLLRYIWIAKVLLGLQIQFILAVNLFDTRCSSLSKHAVFWNQTLLVCTILHSHICRRSFQLDYSFVALISNGHPRICLVVIYTRLRQIGTCFERLSQRCFLFRQLILVYVSGSIAQNFHILLVLIVTRGGHHKINSCHFYNWSFHIENQMARLGISPCILAIRSTLSFPRILIGTVRWDICHLWTSSCRWWNYLWTFSLGLLQFAHLFNTLFLKGRLRMRLDSDCGRCAVLTGRSAIIVRHDKVTFFFDRKLHSLLWTLTIALVERNSFSAKTTSAQISALPTLSRFVRPNETCCTLSWLLRLAWNYALQSLCGVVRIRNVSSISNRCCWRCMHRLWLTWKILLASVDWSTIWPKFVRILHGLSLFRRWHILGWSS